MNLPHAAIPVTPAAVPPPEPVKDARRAEPVRSDDAERAERQFENALREELRRKAAPVLPMPLPWQVQQAPVPVADKDEAAAASASATAGIEAASGLAGLTPRALPWAPAPMLSARPLAVATGGELEIQPVSAPQKEEVGRIEVLVEAHLPPVQPLVTSSEPQAPVHVADFPQVVTGTVQKMVKDNQPITQLDFEISPPHIGPVNMQVQLQGSAVNVQLVALTLQAKAALESQIGNITSILQAHSFTPGQIKVVTAPAGRSGAGSTGQKGEQPAFGFFSGGRKRSGGEQDALSATQA